MSTFLSARTIGGAGTGKTTELVAILEKLVERLRDPLAVGYVSFTRAARREAAARVADRFNVPIKSLEEAGWYRTLHSICYHQLQCRRDDLCDTDAEWLEEAMQERVTVRGSVTDEADAPVAEGGKTDADFALSVWAIARQRMVPVEAIWRPIHDLTYQVRSTLGPNTRMPLALHETEDRIEQYEQAKRLDGRRDFCDLLAQFAGVKFSTDGPEDTTPAGEVPALRAWILDEAQDISPLAGRVFSRLLGAGSVQYVYLSGDPFQAIFQFSGADHRVFREWPVQKERIAPKSYRCPAPVLALGEKILQQCSDYFDRRIAPADHEGEILREDVSEVIAKCRPDESWLILTRAGYMARHLGATLTDRGVPWRTHGGTSTWQSPKRLAATMTLWAMEEGKPIHADEWPAVLHFVKSTRNDRWFTRGTKKRWNEYKRDDLYKLGLNGLVTHHFWENDLGMTPAMIEAVRSGRWRDKQDPLVPYAARTYTAINDWGYESLASLQEAPRHGEPGVTLGTIHSAKGSEADNVLLLTTTTHRCRAAVENDPDEADAEHRLFYVGATRARRRLVVAREKAAEQGFKPEYNL